MADEALVHGWRFWKDISRIPAGLVSGGLCQPPGTTGPVICTETAFTAPRCPHCGAGFKPKCERWCGCFAFWTLEQSRLSPLEAVQVITPVVASPPAYWSPYDPRGTAWRGPALEVRGIMTTDHRGKAARRLGDRLGIPIWSEKALRFTGSDLVGIRRAIALADELGLPNVRASATSGISPAGPTAWNDLPGVSHRRGAEAVELDAMARLDELQESGASCEAMRAAYLEAMPAANRAQRRARARQIVAPPR
jgi:hypothetical protein